MSELVLTGRDLLKKVSELSPSSNKKSIARAAGYVTVKDGKERVNLAKFMNALLEAKGVALEKEPSRTGRSAGYRIQVQGNGNLLIGAAYTREMELEPGTEFKIVLGRKFIKLVKLGADDLLED